jgi:hypothetical protein
MAGYSAKAQPYLDAIATGVFTNQGFRDWLLLGTLSEALYRDSRVLLEEQRNLRWRRRMTRQPFWANYHCGRDSACRCRIPGSVALESDAVFYLRNMSGKTLALHIEFKHKGEPLSYGQSEGYPLRAECFRSGLHHAHPYSLPHDDWATILFCDEGFLVDPRAANFQRAISHDEAGSKINALGGLVWPTS